MSCSKKTPATSQEIRAALKLIELLYIRGEIPQHVYRNICAEYDVTELDSKSATCYHLDIPQKDAV